MAHFQQLFHLLADEQQYYKHLLILLDTHAHNSLLSLSAYASVVPAPSARAIVAVAGCLAGADDALRRYAASIEQWLAEVRVLKDLEEEDFASTSDDRGASTTRSLKRVKKQRMAASPFSDTHGSASGSRVDVGQPEAHASAADIGERQRRLDAQRTAAVQRGLSERCRAMVECGRTWAEMGEAGLRVLEGADHVRDTQFSGFYPSPRIARSGLQNRKQHPSPPDRRPRSPIFSDGTLSTPPLSPLIDPIRDAKPDRTKSHSASPSQPSYPASHVDLAAFPITPPVQAQGGPSTKTYVLQPPRELEGMLSPLVITRPLDSDDEFDVRSAISVSDGDGDEAADPCHTAPSDRVPAEFMQNLHRVNGPRHHKESPPVIVEPPSPAAPHGHEKGIRAMFRNVAGSLLPKGMRRAHEGADGSEHCTCDACTRNMLAAGYPPTQAAGNSPYTGDRRNGVYFDRGDALDVGWVPGGAAHTRGHINDLQPTTSGSRAAMNRMPSDRADHGMLVTASPSVSAVERVRTPSDAFATVSTSRARSKDKHVTF